MKLWRRNRKKKISTLERDLFLREVDEILANLTNEDRKKLDFARDFVHDWFEFSQQNVGRTVIGPMDTKTFEFFVFAILIEYEYQKLQQNPKELNGFDDSTTQR